jgi:hypothetical protein
VKEDLKNRINALVKEKGAYAVAIFLVAAVLLSVNFPIYLMAFFGVFVFFVWKAFSQPQQGEIRGIFEFYLAAHEMLRDDEKRWFGFEMQEVLHGGERVLNTMPDPPPLMLFTLGALHNKMGNHEVAVRYLSAVEENEQVDEKRRLIASPELKAYVRVLRKIEREPAEAPQTSAAVRALERARRNRAAVLLEESRKKAAGSKEDKMDYLQERAKDESAILDLTSATVDAQNISQTFFGNGHGANGNGANGSSAPRKVSVKSLFEDDENEQAAMKKEPDGRQSISEVLKDIYDR